MFAVRDKRTGKFLRNFSGSYNTFRFGINCKLVDKKYGKKRGLDGDLFCVNLLNKITSQEIHDEMWNSSIDGAKIYKSIQGLKRSIGRTNRQTKERTRYLLDWMEVVAISIKEI